MPIDILYTKRKQKTSGIFKNDQSISEEMQVLTLNSSSPTHKPLGDKINNLTNFQNQYFLILIL